MIKGEYQYSGDELEIFSAATNWKNYIARLLKPFIKGTVLEAGAGIGTNTTLLLSQEVNSWILLEPDQKFCAVLNQLITEKKLPATCKVFNGYTTDMKEAEAFDAILYIDVIEHIEDDIHEIETATWLLKKDGHLIVVSPAHNYLMSPFDKAIGHYRRYSAKSLLAIGNNKLELVNTMYVDSLGFFASLANRFFLKQKYPTKKQISLWDKGLVPLSKLFDKALSYKAGKTIIVVWKKK